MARTTSPKFSLNKNQIEAVVEEVQERLEQANNVATLPDRAKKEWEELNKLFDHKKVWQKELSDLQERVSKMENEEDGIDEKIEKKVEAFEKKHNLDVDWKHLNDDEQPGFSYPSSDLRDKIRRQITIMTIDQKSPITADDLIEKIVGKISSLKAS